MIANNIWVIIILALWTIPWKGWALWKSARRGQSAWFVMMFLFNSLAILEILYIFVFSRERKKEEEKKLNSIDSGHNMHRPKLTIVK